MRLVRERTERMWLGKWTVERRELGMARQRAFSRTELLDATEQLLLERGYDGFQLKGLAQKLPGARSTIYEYYANKEEIVAACMRRTMERMLEACMAITPEEPVKGVRETLVIFLQQAGFHKLMVAAGKVNPNATAQTKEDIAFVESGHQLLKEKLMSLFEAAREQGFLRQDIPVPVIASVFFHAIETPNWLNLPAEQWADTLFSLWWNGGENGRPASE